MQCIGFWLKRSFIQVESKCTTLDSGWHHYEIRCTASDFFVIHLKIDALHQTDNVRHLKVRENRKASLWHLLDSNKFEGIFSTLRVSFRDSCCCRRGWGQKSWFLWRLGGYVLLSSWTPKFVGGQWSVTSLFKKKPCHI